MVDAALAARSGPDSLASRLDGQGLSAHGLAALLDVAVAAIDVLITFDAPDPPVGGLRADVLHTIAARAGGLDFAVLPLLGRDPEALQAGWSATVVLLDAVASLFRLRWDDTIEAVRAARDASAAATGDTSGTGVPEIPQRLLREAVALTQPDASWEHATTLYDAGRASYLALVVAAGLLAESA